MVKKTWLLTGRIVSGVQKAAFFTGLEWVQKQCKEKLGFEPYPGTLNLRVEVDGVQVLEQLQTVEGEKLIPPDPEFCEAKVLPVCIGSEKGAILIPEEDVRVHGDRIVEVIAPLRLKDALDVADVEAVTLVISVAGD